MGIQVEFNSDLALRRYGTPERRPEECLPERLEAGRTYKFLKYGQRNYWFGGEIPLVMTEGNERLSRPLASIRIVEATHFVEDGSVTTKGLYRVIEVYGCTKKVHFEGFQKR
jgi:hypothetical protein